MNAHEYPTKMIAAELLTKGDVLVGESGGLSAVYEVGQNVVYQRVNVTTEHGSLIFEQEEFVKVYDSGLVESPDPSDPHKGHFFRIFQEENVEYRSIVRDGKEYVDFDNPKRGEVVSQTIYCATCGVEAPYFVEWDDHGQPEIVPLPTEEGECDECGNAYPLPSRDGRCGSCGNCSRCCTHDEVV